MFSLGRVGLSLFSFTPSLSFNSSTTTTPAAPEEKKKTSEEELEDSLKQINEKIRSLTVSIQEIKTKLDGYRILYQNAVAANDTLSIGNLEITIKALILQKYQLENQRNYFSQQQLRMLKIQGSTEQMKMTVACVKATTLATAQLKTEMKKIDELDPEESNLALYEMMEKLEDYDDLMSSYSSTPASADTNREFEAYLSQRNQQTSQSSSIPTTPQPSPIPSYLSTPYPSSSLFPEFESFLT